MEDPGTVADESITAPRPRAWRRHKLVLAVVTAIAVGGVAMGASAVAGGPTVTGSAGNGAGDRVGGGDRVRVNDLSQVSNVHNGHVVTQAQIESLNSQGQAMFSAASPELTCQGIMLYFDTAAQADDYGLGYRQRTQAHAAAAAADPALAGDHDVCAEFADSPRFAPAGVQLPAASWQS